MRNASNTHFFSRILLLLSFAAANLSAGELTVKTDPAFTVITDSAGKEKKIIIINSVPPLSSVDASRMISFSCTASPQHGTVTGYLWRFGANATPSQSTSQNPGAVTFSPDALNQVTDVSVGVTHENGPLTCARKEDPVSHVFLVPFGLAIDSDNSGTIDSADDSIEDDSSMSGKVIFVNQLDRTGNGIPDFADGIDKFESTGSLRCGKFTVMRLKFPSLVDRSKAKIKFTYPSADPNQVVQQSIQKSTVADYKPGSEGKLRIWMKDGPEFRRVASVSHSGDFIAAGEAYPVAKIFTDGSDEATFYIEGINPSEKGAARIEVEIDLGATGSSALKDAVRLTVSPLEIVYTDVTGLHGIGDAVSADVPRIPKDQQPDGVACDWMAGVKDGAVVLVRVITSPEAADLITSSKLGLEFGYVTEKSGQTQPTFQKDLPAREGVLVDWASMDFFINPKDSNSAALKTLEIEVVGEKHKGDARRIVAAARMYHPPFEFDTKTPLNPLKERKVSLAIELSKLSELSGAKPNAIALVRPPLVLTHGVNSGPEMWEKQGLVSAFDTSSSSFGFICNDFRVNHSVVDSERSDEGNTLGFGEITHMYRLVAKKILDARNAFHLGTHHFEPVKLGENGKRVAVQKVDALGHSYGGLLTRWYIERAGSSPGKEFNDRRDVRKLITLGTPHRGSPLANMVCEAFKNGLIDNARAEDTGPLPELVIHNFLETIDHPGVLPNALTAQRNAARHAYQVFSVNSERLNQLNAQPFHNDVAYGAVIGTESAILGFVNLFSAIQPIKDENTTASKPYFPWVYLLNHGADDTDGVVPRWSAELGVPTHNRYIEINHVNMGGGAVLNQTVRAWLNNADPDNEKPLPMPLGNVQRPGLRQPPVSVRNAYAGSQITAEGTSNFAGLERNAIIKVELQPGDEGHFYGVGDDRAGGEASLTTFGTAPANVGIRPSALTGMIRRNQIGSTDFTIVVDRVADTSLHKLGKLNRNQLNIAAAQPQDGDYAPYRIPEGRIGRRQAQKLTGPNDAVFLAAAKDYIGYESSAIPNGGQCPPTAVLLPEFVLPVPLIGGANRLILTLTGAAETSQAKKADQTNQVDLYAQGSGKVDHLLDTIKVTIPHGALVWDGLLIPYSVNVTLTIDGKKGVSGAKGSSGENPARVYQQLREPGTVPDPISGSVQVP